MAGARRRRASGTTGGPALPKRQRLAGRTAEARRPLTRRRTIQISWPKDKQAQSAVFSFKAHGRTYEGFVVKTGPGDFKAYINRCPHAGSPLDFGDSQFYTEDGKYLLCRAHGALFEPSSGHCVGGPCAGQSLEALSAVEIRPGRLRVSLPPLFPA